MRPFERSLALAAAALALALALAADAPEDPKTAAAESARAAADALTSELLSRLQAEMKEGGPASAVLVCSVVAPEIARERSAGGATVRRVSLKARNPADAPDAWERERLLALEAGRAAGEALPKEIVETVEANGRTELRYLRPIVVGPPCLACHGERAAMDAEVRKILDDRYPGDPAIGYRAGDLRGAVSVRVPIE